MNIKVLESALRHAAITLAGTLGALQTGILPDVAFGKEILAALAGAGMAFAIRLLQRLGEDRIRGIRVDAEPSAEPGEGTDVEP